MAVRASSAGAWFAAALAALALVAAGAPPAAAEPAPTSDVTVEGPADYVRGLTYQIVVSAPGLGPRTATLQTRVNGGDWSDASELILTGDDPTTVRVFPSGPLRQYRVVLGDTASRVLSMRRVEPSLTASAPATYRAGGALRVDVASTPAFTGEVEVWQTDDGFWRKIPGAVGLVDGAGSLLLYPDGERRYQVRVGVFVSPVISSRPDGSVPAGFEFRGAGWGHGVGMSQYGAAAMARHGYDETDILTYYYTGTQVETLAVELAGPEDADGDETVRVQVFGSGDDSTSTATLRVLADEPGASGDWVLRFYDASSTPLTDAGAARTLAGTQGEDIVLARNGSTITATVRGASASGSILALEWEGTTAMPSDDAEQPYVRIYTAGGEYATHGAYRHGRLVIGTLGGTRLNIVNVLKLNTEYLYGIGEVPSSWPSEALQAQAIAARNYAAAHRSVLSKCDCQLYDDTRSQNYTGWVKESEGDGAKWGKRWVAAVDATTADGGAAGQFLTYGSGGLGNLVTAYYFSSSGGQTENSEDVWSAPLSYLRSVPDLWSLDPTITNRNASWTATVDQAKARQVFGLPDVVAIEVIARTGSGPYASADLVRATSSTGETATLARPEKIRISLGLKSAWIRAITPV